jgi:hypothetical protein
MRKVACCLLVLGISLGASFNDAHANDNSLAQQKSIQQASQGRMRHVGGSFGSGRYEGVGFSSRSADEAIRSACYWGKKTPVGIGVARGANGWYATVLYR